MVLRFDVKCNKSTSVITFCELFQGTLLLKLSSDKAPVVYALHGLSAAPQVLRRITRQFPAKTKFTELLPVCNWTNRQQRFECNIENLDNVEAAEVGNCFARFGILSEWVFLFVSTKLSRISRILSICGNENFAGLLLRTVQ